MCKFLEPKRVNFFFAYPAIAFGLFPVLFAVYEGIALTNEYFQSINNGKLKIYRLSKDYDSVESLKSEYFRK